MDTFLEMLRQFGADLQNGLLPQLGIWNYVLLMILIIIQGPVFTMVGGAAAAAGLLQPLGVLGVAITGNLGADAFWYSVGFTSKVTWIDRWFGRRRELVQVLQCEMQQHAPKILLLAKLSVGMAVPAVLAAGLGQVPWRKWFPIVVAGEIIWTGTLLLIGYFAAETLIGAERAVLIFGALISAGLFVLIALHVPRKLRQHLAG
jgi:membrane protein DedA with SNARE-associated domain